MEASVSKIISEFEGNPMVCSRALRSLLAPLISVKQGTQGPRADHGVAFELRNDLADGRFHLGYLSALTPCFTIALKGVRLRPANGDLCVRGDAECASIARAWVASRSTAMNDGDEPSFACLEVIRYRSPKFATCR